LKGWANGDADIHVEKISAKVLAPLDLSTPYVGGENNYDAGPCKGPALPGAKVLRYLSDIAVTAVVYSFLLRGIGGILTVIISFGSYPESVSGSDLA
jgi:hypothetical protein